MLIDFVSASVWAAPQSGASSSSVMAFPRVLLLILLILAGALVLFYGKSLSYVKWRIALSTAIVVKQKVVEETVKDHRRHMDAVAARRLSRETFLREHGEFNYNVPPHKDKEMGLDVKETYVKNSRGLEIFLKSWVPAEKRPKGLIFICHGYGDSVTFFFEGLARVLAIAGYAVYGMDYPGFGLSEGLHGYIPNFDTLVDDVMEQYRMIKERPENKGLSCFLFGESMGGAVALKAHLKGSSMWDGAVLVAPMCKIASAMYPPWFLVQIMIALAHIVPTAKLVPHTDIAEIGFRDLVKREKASYNPAAYIGNPRLGTALQLLQTTDYIESKLTEVSLPLLVLHGAADQVTDPSISILLHEKAKSKDKSLRLYDDAWHCLLQGEPDPVVEKVMMDILSWLDAHADSNQDFNLGSEQEMEHRLAMATSSMIQFGKYNLIEKLL